MDQSDQEVNSNLNLLRMNDKDDSGKDTKKTDTQGSKDTEKAATSSTEDVQLSFEGDEYYHGLLPKEDLPFLLKEIGDFVTRSTPSNTRDNHRILVLSVKTLSVKCQKSFRHIVLRVKKVDGKDEWRAFENTKFGSLKELIDTYVKESILIRGIKQQPWEFRNDDVKLKSVIGTGQFGDVKAGEVVIKGKLKKVAVKLGKEDDSGHRLNKEQLKELLHEARLMRLFKHENILKTYGVAVHKEPIMIILELILGLEKVVRGILARWTANWEGRRVRGAKLRIACCSQGRTEGPNESHKTLMNSNESHKIVRRTFTGNTCNTVIKFQIKGGCILEVLHSRRGHISEYEKAGHMCLGTAEGLAYLHAHRCIHRDIAARNVLYTHDKIAKISDFGLSYVGDCYVVRRSKKIPLRWTAPESFTTFKFTAKTDVYSFAIFMWEVLTDGDEPYAHKTNIEVRRMVEKGDRLARPKGCSNETFSIVEKCWISNPDFRCSMKEV
ncbi:unnamed protein product [Anisakis simplex]|uniref:Tyrosine-protein kinase n=1 Tax=Anisakis simplex TaxID=6269 RepID=A0A0M3K1I5_ANISI|nr:unnamed protein product [Anisakis simplex]